MSFISKICSSAALLATAFVLAGCVNEDPVSQTGGSNGGSDAMSKIINTPANAIEGELLVCLSDAAMTKSGTPEPAVPTVEGLDNVKFEKIFKETELNSRYLRKYNLHKWYRVVFDGMNSQQAAQALAAHGEVAKVQYNTRIASGVGDPMPLTDEMPQTEGLPLDDKYLKDQWHYINSGDQAIAPGAVEGADINVKDVWSRLTAGDSEIIVAILDGPVKYTHPDLKDNMWVNPFETEGNKTDEEDGNGYIDDIHGWNFIKDTCKIAWDAPGASGHGTHVAGTVAAVNNNGIGVSGVAGGSGNGDGVRIMSCEMIGTGAGAYTAAQAFIYAADNGAHIAQCSWGCETEITSDYQYFYTASIEYWAIQYFLDKDRCAEMETKLNTRLEEKGLPKRTKIIDGPVVVFAAGNSRLPLAGYPGALMDCICVTSVGPDGLPASYTNCGPGCNIAAPGGDYYLKPVLSTDISNSATGIGDYGYRQGTSMAAPHVSGIAALGLSYAKKIGKTFTREEFTSLLLSSVNDIDSRLSHGYKYLGVDNNTGAELAPRPLSSYQYNMGTGTIDAWKFMMNLEGTPCLSVKVGNQRSYNLDQYFGTGSENLTYVSAVEIDRESMAALGIKKKPHMENGRLVINPCKVGSGKVKVTAIAGGNNVAGSITGDYTGNGDIITIPNSQGGMGGTYITREISVISRGAASDNGGWL